MYALCDSVRSWEMNSKQAGSMKHVVPRSLMAYPTASRRTSFTPFSDSRSSTVVTGPAGRVVDVDVDLLGREGGPDLGGHTGNLIGRERQPGRGR